MYIIIIYIHYVDTACLEPTEATWKFQRDRRVAIPYHPAPMFDAIWRLVHGDQAMALAQGYDIT